MTGAISTLQAENDRVRVTRWQLPAGSETGFHVHEMDYVIVPVEGGQLTIADRDGNRSPAEMQPGVSYARPAGVAHNVINDGATEIVFVEVELK